MECKAWNKMGEEIYKIFLRRPDEIKTESNRLVLYELIYGGEKENILSEILLLKKI